MFVAGKIPDESPRTRLMNYDFQRRLRSILHDNGVLRHVRASSAETDVGGNYVTNQAIEVGIRAADRRSGVGSFVCLCFD